MFSSKTVELTSIFKSLCVYHGISMLILSGNLEETMAALEKIMNMLNGIPHAADKR